MVRTVRPHQWVKNVFVAAPLVFAKRLGDATYLGRAALAVLAFCLLSGAVYAFNDVRDVEADRAHPRKRLRPIAAGQLGERAGLVLAAALAVIALTLAVLLSPATLAWTGGYLALNVLYTLELKHVAFVDVLVIAAGFIGRVAAGGAAIAVTPSPWLLVCTGLLAVFFGLGKRAHELSLAQRDGRDAAATRASLAGYRLEVVRVAMIVLGVATSVAYVLYTIDRHTVSFFGTDRLPWSAPFAVLGLTRFAWLTLGSPSRDSPTDAMLRDPLFLVNLAAWAATILVIVYR
ncbi:MAG TPA: decaprenyl-phosphate phosphoribosyltransferase [Kofleriaceae bacterium]|nr:decaprenyl-phosphate phosphoribosyltransferase [Kofleriaceae bacterium]